MISNVSKCKPCTGNLVRDVANFVLEAEGMIPKEAQRANKSVQKDLVSLLLCDLMAHSPRSFRMEEEAEDNFVPSWVDSDRRNKLVNLFTDNSFLRASLSHGNANDWSLKSQGQQILPLFAERLGGVDRWSKLQADLLGISPFEEYVREKIHLYFNHRG